MRDNSLFLQQTDLYSALGVSPVASQQEIRKAYLKRVVTEHPDKGGTRDNFDLIQQAYDILSSAEKRSRYDEKRRPKTYENFPTRNRLDSDGIVSYRDGIRVEYHAQSHKAEGTVEYQAKGGAAAGQSEVGCEGLSVLTSRIHESAMYVKEHPADMDAIKTLVQRYVERGRFHLSLNKLYHAMFDAEEALAVCPDDCSALQLYQDVKNSDCIHDSEELSETEES